jgi:hypothetical protein
MKVVVQIYPSSSGPSRRSEARALEIACGQGEQLVRWLAYAACLKLEYVRRGVTRKYLPQAVIGKDGLVIDVDHVLKEVSLVPRNHTALCGHLNTTPKYVDT